MTAAAAAPRRRNVLLIGLWTVQILLALFYGGVGLMKISQPIAALAASMSWVSVFPAFMVRFIGLAELAGALGLILPVLTGILPRLTVYAGLGLTVLQMCAMIYHLGVGEFMVLPLNLVLLALAAFVFWGRARLIAA